MRASLERSNTKKFYVQGVRYQFALMSDVVVVDVVVVVVDVVAVANVASCYHFCRKMSYLK